MDIEHTEVNDNLKGQGTGRKLLLKIVQEARQLKIEIPLCYFAKKTFDKDTTKKGFLN